MASVFDGKVVLVTGASGGIGSACAQAFRKRGARLALTARDEQKLRELAGAAGFWCLADLREPGACSRVVEETLAHYGRIDILINAAGVGLYVPASEAPMTQARAIFDLNFFVLLEMTQQVSARMRQQRSGTIVNISSIAGMMTLPWLTLYSASKHAVCALTDGLRMELRSYGVHAMYVCPGYVDTGFQTHALAGSAPAGLQRRRPLWVTPEQCAAALVRGVERKARRVVIPKAGWLAITAARFFPALIEPRLEKTYLEIE